MKSDKIYIYNIRQADFYMKQGVKCLGTEKHRDTGKIFYVFGWYESQDAYKLWSEHCMKFSYSDINNK